MSATILVADDHDAIRDLIARVLTSDGHAVTCVADGAELLRITASRSFDLVLTDLSMPKIDGLTVIRLLRAEPCTAQLPIIAMSADPCVERDAHAAGANAFLAKPFLLDELLTAVECALQAARPMALCHPTESLANHAPMGIMAPRERIGAWKQLPATGE